MFALYFITRCCLQCIVGNTHSHMAIIKKLGVRSPVGIFVKFPSLAGFYNFPYSKMSTTGCVCFFSHFNDRLTAGSW